MIRPVDKAPNTIPGRGAQTRRISLTRSCAEVWCRQTPEKLYPLKTGFSNVSPLLAEALSDHGPAAARLHAPDGRGSRCASHHNWGPPSHYNNRHPQRVPHNRRCAASGSACRASRRLWRDAASPCCPCSQHARSSSPDCRCSTRTPSASPQEHRAARGQASSSPAQCYCGMSTLERSASPSSGSSGPPSLQLAPAHSALGSAGSDDSDGSHSSSRGEHQQRGGRGGRRRRGG